MDKDIMAEAYFEHTKLTQQLILAGMCMNPGKIPEIKRIITRFDFSEVHQSLWDKIIELHSRSLPIDIVTVAGTNEAGAKMLSQWEDVSQDRKDRVKAVVVDWARNLKEMKVKFEISKMGIGDYDTFNVNRLKAHLAKLENQGLDRWYSQEDQNLLINDILSGNSAQIIAQYPFPLVNRPTRGIAKGQFIIVAARPSVGKSAFLQNMASSIAAQGKKVLFCSIEMSAEMILMRALCSVLRVNIFDPEVVKNIDMERLIKAQELVTKTFTIYTCTSTGQLETKIEEQAQDYDMVIVDYLQLLQPKHSYRSDYERITYISNELKQMSIRFNMTMMVACQYNRDIDGKNPQPELTHLKGSGAIEQDADVVISLWNDKRADALNNHAKRDQHGKISEERVYIDILKNRNGWTLHNDAESGACYYLNFKKNEFKFSTPE